MKKLYSTALALILLTIPAFVHAVDLVNPLGPGVLDVRLLFARVISAALSIVGSLALLMFVYGGVLWMTSRGETKQVTKGKDTIMWATLGLVIIFSAYTLVSALIQGITTGSAA